MVKPEPEFEKLLKEFLEKRTKRVGVAGYRVLVREPGVLIGRILDGFYHIQEARDYIKGIACGYQEGTLLYITHPPGGLKETYVVNELGEAIKRPGRGWTPFGSRSIEEGDLEKFKTLRGAIEGLKKGYVYEWDLEDEEAGNG